MPKIVDHDSTRAEVAEAAQRVIARVGIAAATLREIADEAGCTTGKLAHYFPDKDALLLFALRSTTVRFGQRVFERGARGADRIRAVLEQALPLDRERQLQWEVWIAFWGQAVGNAELAAEQLQLYRGYRQLLEDLVREGQADGTVVRSVDAGDEADRLVALVDGIAFQAVFDRHRWPAARQLEFVDAHLRNVVKKRAGTRAAASA